MIKSAERAETRCFAIYQKLSIKKRKSYKGWPKGVNFPRKYPKVGSMVESCGGSDFYNLNKYFTIFI